MQSSCIVCASSTGDAVPCCGACVCHACLRGSAAAAGRLFACPACRDQDAFRAHTAEQGIKISKRITDYVSSGAAPTNELLCCAETCRSPHGPTFDTGAVRLTRRHVDEDQSRWRLIACLSCGGSAIHAGCAGGKRLAALARWRPHEARWRCGDCGGSDAAPEFAESPFVVGDRIEARWAGRATWFPGVIEAINGDNYDILYDDTETEAGVVEALIRLEPTSAAPVPVATQAPAVLIPGWVVRACAHQKRRVDTDTVQAVAQMLVQCYRNPLLYRTPRHTNFWTAKANVDALLDQIIEAASAQPYAYKRRLLVPVRGIRRGALILKQTLDPRRKALAKKLAYGLLGNAHADIIAKADARWDASPGADAVAFAHADELFTRDVVKYFEDEIAAYLARAGLRGDYPPHDSLVVCTKERPVRLEQFEDKEPEPAESSESPVPLAGETPAAEPLEAGRFAVGAKVQIWLPHHELNGTYGTVEVAPAAVRAKGHVAIKIDGAGFASLAPWFVRVRAPLLTL